MERRNGQHSNVDCHLTSTVSNDDFTGDVIASSTSLVYEDPVVTEESPDASVVNTVTHSELVFELDPKTASKEDIKNAYYRLSKIYHPDNQETGDAEVFDC